MDADHKGSVLIVDDEENFAATTAALLQRDGYATELAHTHDSAIELAEKGCFDAILCDINMTGNLQLELTTELNKKHPLVPIVLVTGYPSVETAITALKLSAFAYVLKPLDFNDFSKTIAEAVARGRSLATMRRARADLDRSAKVLQSEMAALTGQNSPTYRTELESYVAFTQQSLISSLADLQSLVQAALVTKDEKQSLELLDCPPLREYRKLLEESVQVLEKTRSAFKSKDLASLRHKIESFLASSPI